MRSSGRNPGSTVIRLRSVPTKSSAPTTSTSDNAICATTRTRRRPKRSRSAVTPRPPAFMAAPGATWVARNAGASPNSTHVRSASALVKPSTRQSVLQVHEQAIGVGGEERDEARAQPVREHRARRGAGHGQQHALRHQLPHDASARRADGQPHRDLALARGGAGEHQVGQVGAGDEQHQRGHAEQDPQRLLVVAAEAGEPRLRRAAPRACWRRYFFTVSGCQLGETVSSKIAGEIAASCALACSSVAPVVQPPEGAQQPPVGALQRARPGRGRTGDARTAARPRRSCARPRSRGSRRRSRPRPGRSMAVQAQRAADGGRVAAQLALPEGMADDHARRGAAGHVVLRREEASRRRADSHRLEEVAAHPDARPRCVTSPPSERSNVAVAQAASDENPCARSRMRSQTGLDIRG